MQIDANKRPMEEVLKIGQHIIPRFQRRYSWGEQNIRDYWSDIISSANEHFLGSMVVSGSGNKPREVIDGQQRLTTTLIALSVIRECYRETGADTRVTGIAQYIEYEDRDGNWNYRLANKDETAEKRLIDCALWSPSKHQSPVNVDYNSFERKAYTMFLELVQEEVSDSDDVIGSLDTIRDAILGTEIVYINVEDRQRAFTIFETLNDRGLSLNSMDLMKNLIFAEIPSNAADYEERVWSSVMENIDKCELNDITPNNFLLHYWNSKSIPNSPHQAEFRISRIRRSANEYMNTMASRQEAAKKILEDMRKCGSILNALSETLLSNGSPEPWRDVDPKWRRDKYENISKVLYGILICRTAEPLPLLFALIRKYYDNSSVINSAILIKYLKEIERFHFRFYISRRLLRGPLSQMYRESASLVDDAVSKGDVLSSLDKFKERADIYDPSDERFRNGIKRIYCERRSSANSFLIRHILVKVELFWGGSRLDFSVQPSLEHLKGLEGASERLSRDRWAVQIGNIMLLPGEINSRLGSEFSDKVSELKNWVNPNDSELRLSLTCGEWTPESSSRRADHIIKAATEIWVGRESGRS